MNIQGLSEFSIPWQSLLNAGEWTVWMLVFGALAGGIIYLVIILQKYNVKVICLDTTAGGIQLRMRRGGLVSEDGSNKFKLFGVKKSIHPPTAESHIFTKNGKKALLCAKIGPTDYIWLKPGIDKETKEANLTPMDQDTLFWYVNMLENENKKYAPDVKWWQNPHLMFWGTLVICFILIVLTFKYNQTWAESGGKIFESAVDRVDVIVKNTIGQVVS